MALRSHAALGALALLLCGAANVASGEACPNAAGPVALGSAQWNGWGRGLDNTRYQPEPAIRASDVAKLALKWAFGYPNGSEFGQPTVVGRPPVRHRFLGTHLLARCQNRLHLLDL